MWSLVYLPFIALPFSPPIVVPLVSIPVAGSAIYCLGFNTARLLVRERLNQVVKNKLFMLLGNATVSLC